MSPTLLHVLAKCVSELRSGGLLGQQLQQFGKEMVDLLKNMPQCRLAYSKFITSYHHYFGRQCRVADYGYSRLCELFDAIPHVIQVCYRTTMFINCLNFCSYIQNLKTFSFNRLRLSMVIHLRAIDLY